MYYSKFSRVSTIILSIVLAIIFATEIYAQNQLDTLFNAGVSEASAIGYVSTPLPDGKVLVGGSFRLVNEFERSFLVRLNADGTVDGSFNAGGSGPNANVFELIALPDGKILVGGGFTAYNDVTIRGLVRLNADGSLDTAFNAGGAGANGTVQGISLQADGKILLSGSNISSYNGVVNKFSVVRVNPDGMLDATFNSPFTTAVFVEEVDVQADGKVLVAGDFTVGSPSRTDIVRLNSDGSIDSTFILNGGGSNGGIYAMTLQPDGKILIGGDFTSYNSTSRVGIARLNTDGSLDVSFVPPGFFYISTEYFSLQSDGKILVAGNFDAGFPQIYPLVRLNTDGSLDNSFQLNTDDNSGYNVKAQPNGQIILTGYFNIFGGQIRNGIVRLNNNGSIDNSFNASFFNLGLVNDIAQQTDGKIVVGGLFRRANGSFNVNVARFNLDGTIDSSFNTGSGANPNGLDFFNTVSAVAIQPDGKILVGGRFVGFNGTANSGIARLNADGSFDSSFVSPLDPASQNNVIDIFVQPDNKILIGGSVLFTNLGQFKLLLRLNSNGSIDNTFNTSGAGPNSNVNSVVGQPDGKILLGGTFTTYNSVARSRIARINTDGTLDTTFNPGTGANGSVFDTVLQSDGKILIGGSFTTFNSVSQNRIGRLNSDGSLDSSFNVGTGANTIVYSIAIEPGGKILIGGLFSTYNGNSSNRLARLNSNGSFDGSFVSGLTGDSITLVRKLLFQADARLLLGGTFTSYSGVPRNNLARLTAPTAATVSISGRVSTSKGGGIANAFVSLTNINGESRRAMTDKLGFYQFDDIEAGQTYIISVKAKGYRFSQSSQTITVQNDIDNVNFTTQ